MKTSVVEFREQLKTALIDLAWRQWTQLGVGGLEPGKANYILDPEALLVFSAYIGRFDQRLFDEIIDWLHINARFINIQRLRVMSKKAQFANQTVLGLIASYLKKGDASVKWNKIATDCKPEKVAETQSLFQLFSGQSMPVVGTKDDAALQYGFKRNVYQRTNNSSEFPLNSAATMLFQLRGIFGVNARSEAMLMFLTHDTCTIQDVADASGFSWRSIQDVLFEMNRSNLVDCTAAKRGRYYYLRDRKAMLNMILPDAGEISKFPRWSSFYNSMIVILETLETPALEKLSELAFKSLLEETFTQKIGYQLLDAEIEPVKFLNTEKVQQLPSLLAVI